MSIFGVFYVYLSIDKQTVLARPEHSSICCTDSQIINCHIVFELKIATKQLMAVVTSTGFPH